MTSGSLFAIKTFFPALIAATVEAKPAAQPYQAALKRFDIRRDQAIVIEDSRRGLAAAEAAGIATVKVHNEFVAFQRAASDYAIPSLSELPDLLRGISRSEGR